MKPIKFDVFVIGSGSAGQLAAKICAKSGLKVGIAERNLYGGVCPLTGCDPKKALLSATEVIEMAKNMDGNGIVKQPKLSWKAMQKFKKKFTKHIPKAAEKSLLKLGVETFSQEASFLNENTLALGDTITVEAKNIVIATGHKPRELSIEGAKHLKTHADFLALKKLPKHMVFVGAGYIGMEFAHMAIRGGAKVTVIDEQERPLVNFDPDLVAKLTQYSKEIGVKFLFNSKVDGLKKGKNKLKVHYTQNDKKNTIKADLVFNATGRVPSLATLNLDKANVAYSEKGIAVNAYLQNTTNNLVYACGDVSENGLPLTSISGLEGKTVARNIIDGNKMKINTPIIPSVVFTLPNIASVGMGEEEAKKRYKNVIINFDSIEDSFNAKRINAPVYAYKVIINKRTNVIVGAHIVGPHAGETINLFSMAIHHKMTIDAIKEVIFTYPSWCNDLKYMV